ncbi:hypothetical protein FJQ87_00470 [Shewanella sp. SNU WT4]|uniref:hypothetical protein n=1 Tax=Shewanella sp. SNU WT4 TaxID=2590015 RepID=UPI00112D63A6|nr:hypothetical protein [Shewanella sp. SNU WT4]QDF65355.1 hypothetical protein FJQ87_00470 [Shewanella sp. SNU WT4]
MKALTVSLILTAMLSASAGAANWSSEARDTDGQTQFYVNLQDDVPQRCRMITQPQLTIDMDLKEGKASQFEFKAWCNVDSRQGKLVVGASPCINNNKKDIIPLAVEFENAKGLIDANSHSSSATNYHAIDVNFAVSNATALDMGDMNVLKIKPVVNGWEKAGTYKTNMYVSLYPQ